jgi:hypothetical protein
VQLCQINPYFSKNLKPALVPTVTPPKSTGPQDATKLHKQQSHTTKRKNLAAPPSYLKATWEQDIDNQKNQTCINKHPNTNMTYSNKKFNIHTLNIHSQV